MPDGLEPATAASSAPLSVQRYSTPDAASYLPAGVPADRYQALVQRVDDLRALTVPFDGRHEASLARLEAARRLKQLTDHRSFAGFELPDHDGRVVAARKELADKERAHARLAELDVTRTSTWRSCATLASNVQEWIREGRPRNTMMQAIDVPIPKMQKSEPVPTAIDRLRQQAVSLRAKLAQIEKAPIPSAQARAKMREQIAALADRGAIGVSRLFDQVGSEISFPSVRVEALVHNAQPGAICFVPVPDVIGMLAYVNRDALVALLDKKIAAEADDARSLTPEQREKQTSQIMLELFAVEVDEATLTFQAWKEGLPIEANVNINPAALLAVRHVVAPPVNPSPGTSPEHAYGVIGR